MDPHNFCRVRKAQLHAIEGEKQKAYTTLTSAAAATAAAAAAACSFRERVREERNGEGDEEGEKYDIMTHEIFVTVNIHGYQCCDSLVWARL